MINASLRAIRGASFLFVHIETWVYTIMQTISASSTSNIITQHSIENYSTAPLSFIGLKLLTYARIANSSWTWEVSSLTVAFVWAIFVCTYRKPGFITIMETTSCLFQQSNEIYGYIFAHKAGKPHVHNGTQRITIPGRRFSVISKLPEAIKQFCPQYTPWSYWENLQLFKHFICLGMCCLLYLFCFCALCSINFRPVLSFQLPESLA